MNCPKCNCSTYVTDSRFNADLNVVRRRRLCKQCGNKFTTIEMVGESKDIEDKLKRVKNLCSQILNVQESLVEVIKVL